MSNPGEDDAVSQDIPDEIDPSIPVEPDHDGAGDDTPPFPAP